MNEWCIEIVDLLVSLSMNVQWKEHTHSLRTSYEVWVYRYGCMRAWVSEYCYKMKKKMKTYTRSFQSRIFCLMYKRFTTTKATTNTLMRANCKMEKNLLYWFRSLSLSSMYAFEFSWFCVSKQAYREASVRRAMAVE